MVVGGTEARLRDDLVESRQESPEGSYFVLKDPATGRYFCFQEHEHFIARQLDGATPPDEIRARVAARFEAELPAEELAAFVATLERRGLLSGVPGAAARNGAAAAPSFGASPLYFRLKAFDPDRLFDRLIRYVRWCFTPWFVGTAIALVAWALVTVFANRSDITRDLVRLWRFESLLLAWVVVLAVTAAHEFAHGLTCRHFGGRVREIGFLLIYFQPAFYCNISDAWLMPEKRRRLWITAAGAFFETFLWALAVLVWRVTERETWLSGLALVVMATSGVKAFFNFNPLIKLDGYYFLSDLLDVPNLRPRAFAWVGAQAKRLLRRPAAVPEASRRERRIFVVYGLASVAFSWWLLTSVLFRFGQYLTARYQGTGAVLFTGLLATVFATPIRRMAVAFPKALVRLPRRIGLLAGVVAGVGLLYAVPLPFTVAGPVELLPARNADVRAEVLGIIEQLYVDEGSRVEAGAPLARLADREYRARLHMLDAEIAEAGAKLRLLQAGSRPEEIAVARLAVTKVEERLAFARDDRARIRQLAAMQAASRADLERSESEAAVLEKEGEEARARLRLVMARGRTEDIDAARQEVARAEADRRLVEQQLARTLVVAPHAGVVTTPKLRQRLGELVHPGDLIAEVHEIRTVSAEIDVSERDIGEVRVGQRGLVRLRAWPAHTFEGTVTAIAPAASDPEAASVGDRVVKVAIAIVNRDGLLKPRMTGYARIEAGQRRALDLVTRRFRRFLRVEFWSWW
ncbi:MAG TPA: efflux RND transporter periplasmic adaptor subunit [Gemmatimonadales bacterium]|jgi:multidrug resistance efflux pump|nr:efflux RND transporter periplasmic adaptor subunit [Gemmatimonadales bacterium]